MIATASTTRFEQMRIDDAHAFETVVTAADLDRFAALSGDFSPLHMDGAFAARLGAAERVVHGVLLLGYLSRLVGMHLPGANGLLQTVNVRFVNPVLAGQRLRVHGRVSHLSAATRTMELKVAIENLDTGAVAARGKVQVGFTDGGG